MRQTSWCNVSPYILYLTGKIDAEQRDCSESNHQIEFEPNIQLRVSIYCSAQYRIILATTYRGLGLRQGHER